MSDLPVKTLAEVEPGDLPVYLQGDAFGAMPRGTRVRKSVMHIGDTHQIGAMATVVASQGPMDSHEFPGVKFFYFVEWDDLPGIPVGIRSDKITAAD
jgi:hypothetical protein